MTDLVMQLRTAQAALSRIRALADEWGGWHAERIREAITGPPTRQGET